MPGSTWITAITSKGKVWSDWGDTSAFISAGGRAPVPTLQTLTPRAWLVLHSPPHPVSQSEGCSQTPFPCSFFAAFPLLFKPKAHQGFLRELCTGEESGSAWKGPRKYRGWWLKEQDQAGEGRRGHVQHKPGMPLEAPALLPALLPVLQQHWWSSARPQPPLKGISKWLQGFGTSPS